MTLGMHQLQAASGQGQAVLSAQACISKLDPITTSPHQPCLYLLHQERQKVILKNFCPPLHSPSLQIQ